MNLIKIIEITTIISFFSGLALPEHREFLFGVPAMVFVMMILFRWSSASRIEKIIASGAINLNDKDTPPEVREHMEKLVEILKSTGKLPSDEKCKDPHCKDCWGLGESEHKA